MSNALSIVTKATKALNEYDAHRSALSVHLTDEIQKNIPNSSDFLLITHDRAHTVFCFEIFEDLSLGELCDLKSKLSASRISIGPSKVLQGLVAWSEGDQINITVTWSY